jgi:hypothetical protein
VTTDHLQELTYTDRKRVHNLKYYTWVEQQGKTYEEIRISGMIPLLDRCARSRRVQIDALITEFNQRGRLEQYVAISRVYSACPETQDLNPMPADCPDPGCAGAQNHATWRLRACLGWYRVPLRSAPR